MKKINLLLAILLISQTVSGQEHKLSFSRRDSLSEIVQYYLKETTSKHFEDPKVPQFLLKDRNENIVFGVGGSVEGKLYYDHQGNRTNFFEMTKPDDVAQYDSDVLDFNLNSTSLVFKILGMTGKGGVIDAFISTDFLKDGGGMQIQQAYIDLFGLRIGKANTGFRDDESINLVDGNSVICGTARKVPQISYSYKFKSGIRAQIGVEFPQSTSVWIINPDKTAQIVPWDILLPDLTANIYYSGERIHLYGGVDSRLLNYNGERKAYKGIPTYAFQFGLNWSFVKRKEQTHKLFAQAIWSHGMADCCNSMRSQGLSCIADLSDDSYLIPNIAGASIGYQAKFGKNTIDLAVSATYANNNKKNNISGIYDHASSVVLNYFRTFFQHGTAGIEGIFGRKYDITDNKYTNVRTYLFIRYDF